jgi:glutamate 5-kinase
VIDLKSKKRITIKIGSNILTDDRRQLDLNQLRHLVNQISFLRDEGKEIILVTSGAIVCGAEALGIDPKTIEEKQASAAVGQVILMDNYQLFFEKTGYKVAQILLTRDALEDKQRAQHAHDTFTTLLKLGVIPIVNENDTVAVDEIKFSDNDTLSSMVSLLMKSDVQVILTDIDGVYDRDPNVHQDAQLITSLYDIPQSMLDGMSAVSPSGKGRGGMRSKVESAQQLLKADIDVIIANGRRTNILLDLYAGGATATFCTKESC